MRTKSVSLLFFIVICFERHIVLSVANKVEPHICKSLEITTSKGFETLRNCKIVVGYVRLVNFELTPTSAVAASIVEEITDYLLVYRIHGLTSLQRIFPRLKLIRGADLLFEKYSLVVFENRELENLGLISLLRIQKGNVRIENNPVLCFVDTVNWVYILGSKTRQDIAFKNKPSHQCPLCNETLANIDDVNDGNLHNHCWNSNAYQRNTIFGSLNCTRECGIYGCNPKGECCSPSCLTGCLDRNCELCATFNHQSDCVDFCPSSYFLLNKRECIKQQTCHSRSLIPYWGQCMEKCPQHYHQANNTCENTCTGHYKIHNAKDVAALVNCQIIRGSLIIELTDIRNKIIDVLESGLSRVKEITKYLKVINSPQLMSLQFLSSLRTIKGEELIDGKYALYVVNNYHLEHIWNQNVDILKGRISFHLNPRLCYDKIMELASSIKSNKKIQTTDASPNSNGERTICGANVRILNASVEDLNATAVRIKVSSMPADELELLIGFVHYYKEAPYKNVSLYDGRHGCGHDDWMMDISPNQYVRHVIRNLKPFTQYAYFVKTLTMTEYYMQLEVYSNIEYFRTLSSKPGPVSKVYYHTVSANEIMIHWWPPLSPNGNISYYLVNHKISKENSSSNNMTNYPPDPSAKKQKVLCKCEVKQPFYSGPFPASENYYSIEQITFDEALANLIYLPPIRVTRSVSKTTPSQETARKNTHSENQRTTRESVTTSTHSELDTSEQQEPVDANQFNKEEEIEQRFQKLRKENEQKAWDLQNRNLTEFQIVKQLPICPPGGNNSGSCRVVKHIEGVHVPSNIHQYAINKLDPEVTYNISVRACLESGECGAETTVLAKIIIKTLKNSIDGAQDLNNDVDE